MTTLWATIVVIGVLVFFHELGHYLAARSVGVRVDRFSIGFPPRLITLTSVPDGWKIRLFFYRKDTSGKLVWGPITEHRLLRSGRKGSGTEYCLALIPLGGYVKMAGVIDESMDTATTHAPDELISKSFLSQVWVMSAGVLMNVLLAFAIFSGIALNMGMPEANPEPIVSELIEDMPAKKAGLQPGDRILTINGEPVQTWQNMVEKIHLIPSTQIRLTLERDREIIEVAFKTTYQTLTKAGRVDTVGFIGIAPAIDYRPIGIAEALRAGMRSTVGSFALIFTSIRMLITGEASFKELGGPIMIAQIAGETAKAGWLSLLSFMAIISVNLALLNILPIPALDGGHILVIFIQAVIRRPLSIKARMVIQQVGMALLFLLMVTVIINDIGRLITN